MTDEAYCLILKGHTPAEIKFSKEGIEAVKKEYLDSGDFKEEDLEIKAVWFEDAGDYIYSKLNEIPNIEKKLRHFMSASPTILLFRAVLDLHNCGALTKVADDFLSGKTTVISITGEKISIEDIKNFETIPDNEIPF